MRELIFSEMLRRVMKDRGLKQTDIAELAGVSQGNISLWLNEALPKSDALYQLSTGLGVSMEYLLTGQQSSGMVMEQSMPYGRRSTEAAVKLAAQAQASLEALQKELKKI